MNPQETIEAVRIMTEWAMKGKGVEAKRRDDSEWTNACAPCWNWSDYIYRLKPKPRIFYIEVWRESPDQDQITGRAFQTIVGASGKYIKVQEVIE